MPIRECANEEIQAKAEAKAQAKQSKVKGQKSLISKLKTQNSNSQIFKFSNPQINLITRNSVYPLRGIVILYIALSMVIYPLRGIIQLRYSFAVESLNN